ncbi:hypothetical protein AYL99_02701 [Fonsecaea erecta]|uniref:Guanine nucleotide-binding protein subunit gamma n=1 Tax=Fonsecaea erecta TaxID=1367422 RepID=A0A178ZUM3_9EURO|nr:hypothetical protein AYL99_02701 [Fonsecaea erecta]OAP63474.1 hypothetical protein AYL99_02701 [Fonsecaea erecta]
MASLIPEETKAKIHFGTHPDQVRLDRATRSYYHQRREIRAIENLQAQWAKHFDEEEAKEKKAKEEAAKAAAAKQQAPRPHPSPIRGLPPLGTLAGFTLRFPRPTTTAPRRAPPTLRRVTRRLPEKNETAIHQADFSEHPTFADDFTATCALDYHAFLFDRYEYFACNNPKCQLHTQRLQELNSRLKEDLERPRVKVAEASMSLINYCNQTRDYMVPSVWGQVDRKEDPYNPQSGGSEGCCVVM